MEINKILSADLLDILFEGKNKSYGAYELRKSYNKRLVVSLSVMLTTIFLLWAGYLLANKNHQVITSLPPVQDTVTLKIIDTKQPELPPLPPPPPAAKIPQVQNTKTIAFTNPQIVSQDVPESEKPPAMADMVDVKIGTINNPDGG